MPNMNADTFLPNSDDGRVAVEGSRPLVNAAGQMIIQNGRPIIRPARQMQVNVNGAAANITVNSVLTKTEWEQLDMAVVPEALQSLSALTAFISRGLTHQLGGLGVLLSQYAQIGEMTAAKVTLDGHTRGDRDRLDYAVAGVPVPIVHKEFSLFGRELAAGRMAGNALDTTHAAAAARVIGEKLESMLLFGDTSIVLNGNTIYGLTTHPNRNTGSGSDWGTAPNAVTFIAAMIAAAIGDNMYGPYIVLVPPTQYVEASTVYISSSDQTQLQRIQAMPQIAAVIQCPLLTAGTIVLVQASRDVIDIAFVPGYGMDTDPEGINVTGVTTLEWASGDGMVNYFKSLAIIVPRVKSTYSSKSGVVHFTGA